MELRVTTQTGHETVVTTVNGKSFERREPWGIYTIEGIPGVGPDPTLPLASTKQREMDEGWSRGEWVAAGVGCVALLLYGL
jgi:hypothetical protein